MSDIPTVELRPARAITGWWTALAAVVVGAAVWIVYDSGGSLLAWGFLVLTLVVAAFFALQLVVPDRFTVELTPDRLQTHHPWGARTIAWDDVRWARVIRVTGEPILELHLEGHPDEDATTGVLLPLGCDEDALHDFLAARLGVA